MNVLYLDCSMGVAGDMLTAALFELFPHSDELLEQLNALGLPGVRFCAETVQRCGIKSTHMRVLIEGKEEGEGGWQKDVATHAPHDKETDRTASPHHHHHGVADIERILLDLDLSEKVRADAHAVFMRIAEAESQVHGRPIDQIHFHEVGTMDAIADVVAVCFLIDRLNPDEIVVSPIQVGGGTVMCAHGRLPVPAPATALLLTGLPVVGGAADQELCTPTGAALVSYFASSFGSLPKMSLMRIGYGAGTKDLPLANVVRALWGELSKADESSCMPRGTHRCVELSCNLDDMTPEMVGFALDCLLKAGALDVFATPIVMKKTRPATMLTVLCEEHDVERMQTLLFTHTTTLGIRECTLTRTVLERSLAEVQTRFGVVRRKNAVGKEVQRAKWEYDDVARIACAHGLSYAQVIEALDEDLRTQENNMGSVVEVGEGQRL